MDEHRCTVIAGTGSYIPTKVIPNSDFLNREFYGSDGKRLEKSNEEIIKKFGEITCIKERRYAENNQVASDLAYLAAEDALSSSGVDRESLDYLVVAHNFGDVKIDNRRSDFVPSLASRVKNKLGIKNPYTIASDLPFGCPGWLEGVIQVDSYFKAGNGSRALVIGAETLSRISDPHDIDSMIYSDGAGATVLQSIKSEGPVGVLSHAHRSDTLENAYLLWMAKSYNPNYCGDELFLKMSGHDLYEYALKTVAGVVKESLDKAGLTLSDVKKALLHQANEKMDEAIIKRLFKLYGVKPSGEDIRQVMPMIISWLGNSSVATVPTLLDLIVKEKVNNHVLDKDDIVSFVSVGAGTNVNSVVYRMSGYEFSNPRS